jgi:pyruvate,orthophosphate dikinase
VFASWNGRRAIVYRDAAGIAHDLGTAVNIQAAVFDNMHDNSATGVAMSRNTTTGASAMEGDYLTNAQGEDVVAGVRTTKPLSELASGLPGPYGQLVAHARDLELHYREMQDMEFTIERARSRCFKHEMGSGPLRLPFL